MANVLDDLASYLQAEGVGTVGQATNPPTAIMKGRLMDAPDEQVALVEVQGREPIDTMGQVVGQVNVERPIIQVLCRAAQGDYLKARTVSESAYKKLHGIVGQTLSGTRYLNVESLHPPYNVGTDRNDRQLVSFDIQVWKELNA